MVFISQALCLGSKKGEILCPFDFNNNKKKKNPREKFLVDHLVELIFCVIFKT